MANTVNLSDGEWKLMQLLWRKPCTITELVAAMRGETDWSKHTVITMLTRMAAKGAVTFESIGRAKVYRPIVAREAVTIAETRSFLTKVYGGSVGSMLNALIAGDALTRDELAQLYAILDRADTKEEDAP